jgi:TonB family protein
MARTFFAALMGAALVCGSAHPAYAASQSWTPSGTWAFDIHGQRCAAAQTYVSEKRRLVLGLVLPPMSESATLLIELPGRQRGFDQETVRLDVGAGPATRFGVLRRSSNSGHVLHQTMIEEKDLSRLLQTGRLSVRTTGLDASLAVPGLAGALAKLRDCTSDLLSKWGLSKEAQSRVAKWPEVSGGSGFGPGDYPDRAVQRGAIGSPEAVLQISPAGRVESCTIVKSSGHDDIDQATCAKAVRLRFKPAMDRDGKPMSSPYLLRIMWWIEA